MLVYSIKFAILFMHRTERGAGMAGYYTIDVHERMKQVKGNLKQPFPHQKEAFAALSKALPTPINEYKGLCWFCQPEEAKRLLP